MVSPALLSTLALWSVPSLFWGELEPGPHAVGFEIVEAHDYSRPYRANGDGSGRLLRLSVWYPAATADNGEAATFRDYVPEDGRDELVVRLNAGGQRASRAEVDAMLETPTGAFRNAQRAEGPFPLIVFASGLMAPSYLNSVLCEYLASHGFVALAVPSLPARENGAREYDQHAVDTQIRDMEFAIHSMHRYPQADITRIGLVAWSLGGVSQALLQMKNPDVRAVVSLDAATGYRYGQELLESSIHFDARAATAAFFHATESRENGEGAEKSFEYLDVVVRGEAYLLAISGAAHREFTSFGSVVPEVVLGTDARKARRRYELMSLYVRQFLLKIFRDDADASEFLSVTPTRHGFDGLVLSRKR